MKVFATVILALSLSVSAMAQGKDTTPPAATKSSTNATEVRKPVPMELTEGLAEWNALNQAVNKIKQENGIDKLEVELNSKASALVALATKEGYHFDSVTNQFVENPPVPAKTETAVPAKSDTKK